MSFINTGFTPTVKGVGIGFVTCLVSLLVYLTIFQGSGTLFYWFALFFFIIGPLVAGFTTMSRLTDNKIRGFGISVILVLGTALIFFILVYAIGIVFLINTINLPGMSNETYQIENLPPDTIYTIPGGARGILVKEDTNTAIVAIIDPVSHQHPGTVLLIQKNKGDILWSIDVPSDNIAVAMDNDTAYIFHHGIGYFINKNTGELLNKFLSMDNYGTNSMGKFQTTGIISTWNRDGTVKPLNRLTFNGIVNGYFIRGNTEEILRF